MFLRAMVTYTDRTRDEDNVGTNNGATDNFVGFMNPATSDATTSVRDNPMNLARCLAKARGPCGWWKRTPRR